MDSKPDGRKLRHIDCNWNNYTNISNGCGTCRVCKHLEFEEYVSNVMPAGSIIDRNRDIENYLDARREKTELSPLLYNLLTKIWKINKRESANIWRR